MNQDEVISQTVEFVKSEFLNESTGHDWWHVYRVWQTSRRFAAGKKGLDGFSLELAALLHDMDDWKFKAESETPGPINARRWLEKLKVSSELTSKVCQIIEEVSFKGAGVPTETSSRESSIVQDADRLDALGAIGIARAFAYGGSTGQPIHDPGLNPIYHQEFEDYRSNRSTTINHFYEKLLLLEERMGTEEGKLIARKRTEFMRTFLARFFNEWDCEE